MIDLPNYWQLLTKKERIDLMQLMEAKATAEEKRRRAFLQEARKRKIINGEVLANFAYVHMRNDETGAPLWPADHHWLWIDLLTNFSIRKLLIIAPPESAKTTWLIAFLALVIATYPERPNIIAAVGVDTAKKRAVALRNIIESPAFALTYPEVNRAQGMAYTLHEWSVTEGDQIEPGRLHPTMFATGTGGQINGSRAFVAAADDLLDFDNTRTTQKRETADQWLHNSFLSRVYARRGIVRVIGTAWHHDDSYSRIRRRGDWVVCHTPLLSDTAEVYATINYPVNYTGPKIGQPVAAAQL
jgi:hypothetical protein